MNINKAAVTLAPVFAALGDSTRIHLVNRLLEGEPRSIVQLAEGIQMSHQGITKHLKVMEQAGLVRAERVGRERHYVGEPATIDAARQYLDDVGKHWDAALQRLKAYVED